MKYFEDKDCFFMAIASSMFTFAFMFLGIRMSWWYFLLGFLFLASSLMFWNKVKQIQNSKHKDLSRLFEEYNRKSA